jgi:hypothetical protein
MKQAQIAGGLASGAGIGDSFSQCTLEEHGIRIRCMCFIGSGHPQLFHNDPAQIDNIRTLFGDQCRGGMRGYELIIVIVKQQKKRG